MGSAFQWLPIVLGGLLSVSVLAASIAWFDAGSRTLWRGADEKWISARISELHPRLRTPMRASILQAAFSSIVLSLCYSGNRGKDVYLFMLSLSVVSQLVPFFIMFLGLWQPDATASSKQNIRRQIWGGLGAFSCAAGIVLSFIPQSTAEPVIWYVSKMLFGVLGFIIIGVFVYNYRQAKIN